MVVGSQCGDDVADAAQFSSRRREPMGIKTHLAGVDLLAAERVVVGTHLDGGCADEVSVGVW